MISLREAFQKKKVELLQVRNCARDILPSQAVATSQSMVEGFETRAIKSPRLKRMNESDPRSDVHYLGSSENKA